MEPSDTTSKSGRKPTVKAAIEKFIESLKAPDLADSYDDLWQNEWASFADGAPTTRAQYTSRYRSAVKAAFGDRHPVLASIRVLDRSSPEPSLRTVEARAGAGGRKPLRREQIQAFGVAVKELDEKRRLAISLGRSPARASVPFKRQLETLWQRELTEMRRNLKNNTILTTTAAYRNELRRIGLDDADTLAIVTAPDDVQQKHKDEYNATIIKRHNSLVAVDKWREIVDAAIAVLPDTDAAMGGLEAAAEIYARDISRDEAVRIGVALGLLTGRRPYEVFCQGVFSPAPLTSEASSENTHAHSKVRGFETWSVLFNGQAKTKGREGTRFDETFAIPVLCPAKRILFAHYVLKKSEFGQVWSEMTNEEFNNDLMREPNPRCIMPKVRRQLFEKHWPKPEISDDQTASDSKKLKAHNIRSLYAEIADQFFRPKSKTKAAFMASALGHNPDDLETANSYMKYHLPQQKDAGPTKRIKNQIAKKVKAEIEKFGHP